MRPWLFLLSAPLLAAASCPTVPKPPSDSTAPALTWSVQKNLGESQDFTSVATMTAKQGDSYFVVLKATNPGGLHELTLNGDAHWKCATREPIPKLHDADLAVVRQTRTLGADGSVKTSDLLSAKLDVKLECTEAAFDSGNEHFEGTATNHYGVKATATLDINVPASWSCTSGSGSITTYGSSHEEASASLAGACRLEGATCGRETPLCLPVKPCGARWGCSWDLWRSTQWRDDLTGLWKDDYEYCRTHSEVSKATEVACYENLKCKCETELVR